MIIRKANNKDIEGIKKIFYAYETASINYLKPEYRCIRNKKRPIENNVKKALAADIKNKNGTFLVAEENKEIVGYIYGTIREDKHPLFKPSKTGELEDIAVLEKFRGRGVGTRLWNELELWFKKKECKLITLSVNVNNKAQDLYKELGFETFYLRMIKKL